MSTDTHAALAASAEPPLRPLPFAFAKRHGVLLREPFGQRAGGGRIGHQRIDPLPRRIDGREDLLELGMIRHHHMPLM